MTNLRHVSNSDHHDEQSDNTDPSGEFIFNSPLPPYERPWRHPSELAQEQQIATPEPQLPSHTIRSIASYAAATSIALSLILLWVVTPRSQLPNAGIEQTKQFALVPESDQVAIFTLGNIAEASDTVVPLTASGFFIGASKQLAPRDEVEATLTNGSTVLLRVLEVDTETGIVWMHAVDSLTHQFTDLAQGITPPSTVLSNMTQGQRIYIASPQEGISNARIAVSSPQAEHQNMWPIDFAFHDDCAGAALDSRQKLIGWCVEINNSHWVVPTLQLVEVLHRLENNVGQP